MRENNVLINFLVVLFDVLPFINSNCKVTYDLPPIWDFRCSNANTKMWAKTVENFSCNLESEEMDILRDQHCKCSTVLPEGILFAGFQYSRAVQFLLPFSTFVQVFTLEDNLQNKQ